MYKCTNKLRLLKNRTFSTVPKWDHDVLICGGGVVGATLAADILRQSNGACNVGIIDLFPPKPTIRSIEEAPDVRVYALSPNSIEVLERIGAWKHIEARSHPYNAMQIWEQSGPGLLKFSAKEMKAKELGRICEDQTIQSAIYQSIEEQGHTLTKYYGYSVDDLKLPSNPNNPTGPAIVSIKPKDITLDNKVLTARLVIGADGGNSTIRRLSGISTWGWGYGQEAVVATIRINNTDHNSIFKNVMKNSDELKSDELKSNDLNSETSTQSQLHNINNNIAYQKYLPTGPLAILPLWNNYASIVWSTTITECKRLKTLSDTEFLYELNKALQTPSDTSKWSIFEHNDGIIFPSFIQSILGKTIQHHHSTSSSSTNNSNSSSNTKKTPIEFLERAKQEVTSVVDTCLSLAQLSDPLSYPPIIESIYSKRVSFPLSFTQAQKYTTTRVALIGDAAHSIHPQAGQGLNLGILDAITLSDGIVRTLQTGGDLGNSRMLKEYEKERYLKNLSMMTVVDVINTMFKDSSPAVSNSTTTSNSTMSNNTVNTTTADTTNTTNTTNTTATTNTSHESTQSTPLPPHHHHYHYTHTHTYPHNLPPAAKIKQFLRTAGMLGIHQLGPVKHHIAKFAMGIDSMKK